MRKQDIRRFPRMAQFTLISQKIAWIFTWVWKAFTSKTGGYFLSFFQVIFLVLWNYRCWKIEVIILIAEVGMTKRELGEYVWNVFFWCVWEIEVLIFLTEGGLFVRWEWLSSLAVAHLAIASLTERGAEFLGSVFWIFVQIHMIRGFSIEKLKKILGVLHFWNLFVNKIHW